MILNRNKILIVDDEKALRVGLAHCVENAGFEPVVAADGEEALQLVEEHWPAMVILDVMMNGLSGLEVCRILRNKPDAGKIKIIFLSAKGQLKEQAEGLEAGGDYYITKPFSYKELIDIIKDLLRVEDE
ncbi:response regulator transcription factor [Gemmatimonadota bacterium]